MERPLSLEYGGQKKRKRWASMDSENVLNWTNFVILLLFKKVTLDSHSNSKKLVERPWNIKVKIKGNGVFQLIPKTCNFVVV